MCGRVWQGFDKNRQRPSLLQEKAFVVLSQADSNHHKQNQKLLCYHYTIGQCGCKGNKISLCSQIFRIISL